MPEEDSEMGQALEEATRKLTFCMRTKLKAEAELNDLMDTETDCQKGVEEAS